VFRRARHRENGFQIAFLKIEQDQVVAVLEVKLADLARIHRGRDGNIAGIAQQPLEQKDMVFLIVDDQDFAVKNVR
jgi:hypothetical protein